MKKLFLLPFLLFAFTISAQQQPKLVETVTTNGTDALVIPYKKYTMPNGLTIVVHEDHSDPIVYCDVTYHVGSAREQEGRSGFAHFFEHMMFQGSGHVADEEHFKLISEAGGELNGSTNTDRTNYFETVPSNYLEMAMWLEADRMGFLLDSVTQAKFEIQRSTVKNERGQNYDNRPYGLVWEKIGEAMFPEGHPYSWETIGYIADLNAANVQDLRNFFMRWYGPNNATLTIAGDVKTEDVLKYAEKYFGSIPRGPEVKAMDKMPATMTTDRCISYEDNIRFPQLTIARPGVATWDADEAPLDALCDIISNGKSSVFYQTFVETKIAQSASMFSSTMELAGQIIMSARMYPGHSPHEADSLFAVAMTEFEKRGVTDDDVQRYKLAIESYFLDNLSSVQGKGAQLAAYSTFTSNPNMIQKDLDRYKKITKEDVMRVYNKYIKGKAAVVLTVYPKGHPEMKARPDNYTPPAYKTGTTESAEYKGLAYNRPKDDFDRFVHPTPGPTPVVTIPALWHDQYANGLKLIGTYSNEIPRTYIQLSISCGHRQEDTAYAGIAALMVKMLDQSTLKHSAADIETELELLGSDVSISAGTEEITIGITCFTRNIDSTLALVYEKMFQPKWDATEFDLMKKQQLESIANMPTQAGSMASLVFNKMLYGDDNIMSFPSIGTTESVNRITLDDVKAYYKKMFSPNIAQFVIVSDLEKDKLTPKLKPLADWASTGAALKPVKAFTGEPGPTKIYLFNKPEAAQSEIRIGRTGMAYDYNGEFYKAAMMNYELGGMFNSHINLKLREEKGWTYGAGSGFSGTLYPGAFVAYAGVRWDASDSAVAEFVKVMKEYAANGISDDELAFTKRSVSQSEALAYEDPYQKLYYMKKIVFYGLPDDYAAAQNKTLMSLTKTDVDGLAKKWIDPDHMVITVVGDKAKIYDGLVKLGYEVIEVDANGDPMPKVATTTTQTQQTTTPKKKKGKKNLKMRNH